MDIREDYFASLAARHLGIELRIKLYDELEYDPQWRTRGIVWSEPVRTIVSAHHLRATLDAQSEAATVWFEGEATELLRRRKTPLPVRPPEILMRRHGAADLRCRGELARWVDLAALPTADGDGYEFYRAISLRALDYWLESRTN
jgi:hypothetical protein